MKIKSTVLLLVAFIFGIITHSIRGELYERLQTDYSIQENSIIIEKGFLRRSEYNVQFNEVTSVEVNRRFRQRLFGQFEVVIYPSQPAADSISIVTNYEDLNRIRQKVEKTWTEE